MEPDIHPEATNLPASINAQDEIVSEIMREFDWMASNRGIWEVHWERTSRVVLPYYSTSFYTQGNVVPGQERNQYQFDVTANAALWKFAAALESEITPASDIWHRLRPTDPVLKANRNVMQWFDQVNDLLFHYRYSPHSGFQANMHSGYVSIGAFGTSCLFTDAFRDPLKPGVKGLRYREVHLGECYFAVNHQGQVDKVYRRFKMSLRQMAQRWGAKALPDGWVEKLAQKPEEEFFVIHAVRPNGQYEPGRLDVRGKCYTSHYILRDQHRLMEVGGYNTLPYTVSRYLTAPGELYGRSPAMNVLPSINVLNEEKKVILKAGHRAADPVLLAHDDGILDGFSLRPGAVNTGAVSPEGRPLVHALPTGNLQIGKELMDDERAAINDAFLVTLFQILIETPQMTATEVLERAREKGALLSPTMGRQQSESIGPLIEREFDLLHQQGLLPPPPPLLLQAGGQYKVEYDAPLNRQMRAAQASGIMRTTSWAAEVSSQIQSPEPMDNFKWDVIIPAIADISSVPFAYLNTPEEIAAIRAKRDQDKQAAQITQALPGMAAMTKAVAPGGTMAAPGQPGGSQ